MEDKYLIEMLGITKKFGNLKANDGINLQLKEGEILALCGENGAGKSTLMSILFGLYEPDEGEIRKDGKPIKITNPNDATKLHIGMVHQHFKLVGNFTVLQNIILGNEPISEINPAKPDYFEKIINKLNAKIFKRIDYKKARNDVTEIMNQYGLVVDLDAKIDDTSVETQQKVEIIKMLYRKNDILIFDEPTAVLTEQEIAGFLDILRNLKREGKSIIFISHKLREIMAVCDRVTIIRKGQYIDTLNTADTTEEEISTMMVGRKVNVYVDKGENPVGEEVLRVENMHVIDKETKKFSVKNVSFNVRKGEIVCLAGIDGNGQNEVIYGLTGLEPISDGKLTLNGVDITKMSILDRNKTGIAHIPGDRHKHGLVLDYTINQNSVLERFYEPEFSSLGFIKFKEIAQYAADLIGKYDVRSNDEGRTITRSMSGGNQQKVIIGREIDRNTDLIVAVQPTRGLDVGAIESIHKILIEQRKNQKAILLMSLELDQVFCLADRILVMFDGEIVGEFKPNEITREGLGLYMSGAKKDKVNAIKE